MPIKTRSARSSLLSGIRRVSGTYRARRNAESLIFHRRQLARLPIPDWLTVRLFGAKRDGVSRNPSELTIVLLHNYPSPPLMERSLKQAGVDFILLKPPQVGPWRNSIKIETILRYVEEKCRTEYLLYVDSNDAVLADDPRRAIEHFLEANCDVLFSSTRSTAGYECMPETKAWADSVCQAAGYQGLYLNAGVFMGRTTALKELLRSASEYLAPNDLSRDEYIRRRRDGSLRDVLPAFPYGVGCDQVILRFLHPRFYPSVKIDYASRLAVR